MDQLIPGADKDLVTPLTKRIAKAYERDLALHQGHRRRGRPGRAHRLVRLGQQGQGQGPRDRGVRQGARRRRAPAQRPRRRRGRGRGVRRRARLRPGRQAATHQRRAHLRHRRRGRAADARPQGHPRRQGRRREHAPGTTATSTPPSSRRWPTPTPRSPGSGSPRTRPRPPGSSTARACSPGPRPAARCRSGRDEGLTKVLFDETTDRIIGAGIVGPNAGDLIAEAALAIEIGADAADIGLTIHPHPTLSETVAMAAEAFEGTITDLYMPKKKK